MAKKYEKGEPIKTFERLEEAWALGELIYVPGWRGPVSPRVIMNMTFLVVSQFLRTGMLFIAKKKEGE